MFKTLKNDLPASIVVFFVALPLCLGIALASGAPLFSGLIAGIVGGIVVGALSGSHIGVSGPAAGLAAIVLNAITTLDSFNTFLVAVVIGGAIQIVFGLLKAGVIAYYFPSSVIKGMLTGIGLIIILKQIPFFFGIESSAFQWTSIFSDLSLGATLIGAFSLLILIVWDNYLVSFGRFFQLVKGPLVVVVVGILFFVFTANNAALGLNVKQLVSVPVPDSAGAILDVLTFPNFKAITNIDIWIIGFTIALVASLETLLCVDASDKLDPDKRVTPTNRELYAQGIGNIVSGLIGGLPITQVIVRSSANMQSGGKSKLSAIIHGFLLLIAVILIPTLINKIPLAVLAAVLFVVGYKLAKPSTFKDVISLGWKQYVPFFTTVIPMVLTGDLLLGIGLGLLVGIIIILIKSYQNSHFLNIKSNDGDSIVKMTLAEEVTFINKGAILKELDALKEGVNLELDVRNTRYLDHDIKEILQDFSGKAKTKNINIKLISQSGEFENPENYIEFFNLRPNA